MESEQRQHAFFKELLQRGKHKTTSVQKLYKKSASVPNHALHKTSKSVDTCRSIYHHRLHHRIGPQHPDYLKLVKRRHKINPNVWMRKPSCAIFLKRPKLIYETKETDEQRQYRHLKLIQEMSVKAPKCLTSMVLEYLNTD